MIRRRSVDKEAKVLVEVTEGHFSARVERRNGCVLVSAQGTMESATWNDESDALAKWLRCLEVASSGRPERITWKLSGVQSGRDCVRRSVDDTVKTLPQSCVNVFL